MTADATRPPLKPRPTRLKAAGRKVWDTHTARYDFRPDELRLLEEACREADLVARLDAALRDGELLVRGSMGQPAINPLVSEVRQHRMTEKALLGALNLPDEDGRAQASRSSKARDAAAARWRKPA